MIGKTLRVDLAARGIATVTLCRPEKGNPYNSEMLEELAAEFARLGADAQVRVVLLRGEGRHFCVGADLIEGGSARPAVGDAPAGAGLIDVCFALDRLPKPTVAVVHGGCIGGGVALAACCDIVLAERGAFFSIPEVRIGFAPAPLMPFFLRAIGARNLRRLGQTGERFTVDEALRIGLVHVAFEPGKADATVAKAVDDLLLGAPGALAELKGVVERVEGMPITPGLISDLQAGFDRARESGEAAEGRAAFREKRKPNWYPES
jgi:methylglutaconyl-CoA hydratase